MTDRSVVVGPEPDPSENPEEFRAWREDVMRRTHDAPGAPVTVITRGGGKEPVQISRFVSSPRLTFPEITGPAARAGAAAVAAPGHVYSSMRGRAIPYGVWENVGWYEESATPGLFKKSIEESARDLPLLLFHDARRPAIGAADRWDELRDGLWGMWRLDTEDPDAQSTARKADDGIQTGLSVGFMPIRSVWTFSDDPAVPDRVERVEGRLLETSVTPTPAYSKAGVTQVRNRIPQQSRGAGSAPRLARWQSELERLRAGS